MLSRVLKSSSLRHIIFGLFVVTCFFSGTNTVTAQIDPRLESIEDRLGENNPTPVIVTPGGNVAPNVALPQTPGVLSDDRAESIAYHRASDLPPTDVSVAMSLEYLLHTIVVNVGGGLAGSFGFLFDVAVEHFIISFGEKYIESGVGANVENVWATVRDIFNLLFIFGLLYIGFQIILGINESQAKKTIIMLVLAALLINFSLFVTKFIIDFSNLAATEVYQLFKVADPDVANGESLVQGVSISRAFTNSMEISAILSAPAESITNGATYMYIIGMFIVFLVLAFVFLAGAILITIRFAALVIYMVFSPAMFLGWIFPGFEKYTQQFWSGFLGQAFFAPVFIFLLYLAYAVTRNYSDALRTGSSFNELELALEGQEGMLSFATVLPFFALTIIFIVMAFTIARSLSRQGSEYAIKAVDYAYKKSMGTATSFAGRNTIGRLAGGASKVDDWLDKGWVRRNIIKRGVAIGTLGIADQRNRDALYEAGKKAKFGGSYSRSDDKDYAKTRKSKLANDQSGRDTKNKIKRYANTPGAQLESAVRAASTGQIIDVLHDYDKKSSAYSNIVEAMTHEQRKKLLDSKEDEFNAVEKANVGKIAVKSIEKKIGSGNSLDAEKVSKLTPKEIDVLGNQWINTNLTLLTNSQVEKLASDSTVLGETEKSNLKKKWGDDLESSFNPSTATADDFKKYMKGRTAKDVAALPPKILTATGAVVHLSEKVLQEVGNRGLGVPDKNLIERNIGTIWGVEYTRAYSAATGTPVQKDEAARNAAKKVAPGYHYFDPSNNHHKNIW